MANSLGLSSQLWHNCPQLFKLGLLLCFQLLYDCPLSTFWLDFFSALVQLTLVLFAVVLTFVRSSSLLLVWPDSWLWPDCPLVFGTTAVLTLLWLSCSLNSGLDIAMTVLLSVGVTLLSILAWLFSHPFTQLSWFWYDLPLDFGMTVWLLLSSRLWCDCSTVLLEFGVLSTCGNLALNFWYDYTVDFGPTVLSTSSQTVLSTSIQLSSYLVLLNCIWSSWPSFTWIWLSSHILVWLCS